MEDDKNHDVEPNHKESFSVFPWFYKFSDGLIAGALGVAVAHPIDIVKNRFENQVISPVTQRKLYRSLLECLKWTWRRDGYLGLYRRASFNILSVSPEKAIKLTFNDYFSYKMEERKVEEKELHLSGQVCAAGMAGMCQCVTTPLEMFRCRLLAAEGMLFGLGFTASRAVLALRPNSWSIIRYMYQQGLTALIISTLLRDVMFSIAFFPFFRFMNGAESKRHNSTSKSFACGFVSGGFSSAIVTPFDVIRRHISNCRWQNINEFKTIRSSIKFIYERYGMRGFYYGGFRRSLVAAPLFGVTEATYHLGISNKISEIVAEVTDR